LIHFYKRAALRIHPYSTLGHVQTQQ